MNAAEFRTASRRLDGILLELKRQVEATLKLAGDVDASVTAVQRAIATLGEEIAGDVDRDDLSSARQAALDAMDELGYPDADDLANGLRELRDDVTRAQAYWSKAAGELGQLLGRIR